jgi:hypothetical protein
MSLRQNYEEVINFFTSLRKNTTIATGRRKLIVNFNNISVLNPGAALVLASELDRWQVINNVRLKPYKPQSWNKQVVRLFNEMGIFDLLETLPKHRIRRFMQPGSQTFFPFLSGTESDGQLASRLMENMSPVIKPVYNERLLYVALSEAMTNVIQHAYPQEMHHKKVSLHNRWWLSGSFDSDSQVMNVLLFDHGVGIPTTLPKSPLFKKILHYIKDDNNINNPGYLIKAAVELGKSKTQLKHRGKGLRQILKFSSESDFGSLYIISHKGEYCYYEDCTDKAGSLPVELGGTFIQWEIKLQKDLRNGNEDNKDYKDCRGLH